MLAIGLLATPCLQAENWPGWRGPRGDGTSAEQQVPTRWDGASGENIVWKSPLPGRGHSSPIVWGDQLFAVSCVEQDQTRILFAADNGIASCFVADTGERLWMERLGSHYSVSLLEANGLVCFLADDGEMKIVRPGRQLEVVSVNRLGEFCFASPAVSQGQLFVRGEKHLFCMGSPAP